MSENLKKHSSSADDQATAIQLFSLFIPKGTKNWSMRFSIPGHGQFRLGLKTPDKDKATALAHRTYWETVNRAESGLSVKNKTTDRLISEWLKLPRAKEPHQKISTRLLVMNRYFGGFIGNQSITDKAMAAYQIWRNAYWITGPGKDIAFLEYTRDRAARSRIKSPQLVRSSITDAMRKAPSPSTQAHENAILRDFFQWMVQEGHLKQVPKLPTIKQKKAVENRPSFTEEELSLFRKTVMNRIHHSTEHNKHIRFMFWCFSEIMLETGLRDTEALHLKWSDIVNFTTDTSKKDLNISIKVHGKSKSRTAIPNPSIIYVLQVLYAEQAPNADDYLFTYKNGNRISSFSSQMNEALKDCNLTTDYRMVKRTCYSFRHYFITKALNDGINIHLLARNTGTSVTMIEKHYSHVSLEAHRNSLIPEHRRL